MKICRSMIFIVYIFAFVHIAKADKGPYDWAYVHLDGLRDEKVKQLRSFCDRIHQQAREASVDNAMINFFDLNLRYCLALNEEVPPNGIAEKISELRSAFDEHYIRNWLSFYDILFIDMECNIFYSIRKELDFGSNILSGDQLDTHLSNCLQAKPGTEQFVDFHYYGASKEPASFFVEPIFKDGKQIGWIALQLAINKINSLFAGTEHLGETSEAIVVNRQGYMLTESNFVSDETILKTRLDDCNIAPKFQEGHGNRIVTDYRGFTVLTSFEVVEFLGAKWLVVVKMDEAQVTTEHFNQHKLYYNGQIVDYLNNTGPVPENVDCISTGDKVVRQVDMDEFVRAKHSELLQTMGVSTCTAVIATYPGKFGYLAHVSPLDKVYGGDATDLIGSITKKIKTYDIYKYERRYVRFVIVARHLESLESIVSKLVAEGFLLSQISVMYQAEARYARVLYDYSKDALSVVWVSGDGADKKCIQDAKFSHNIGEIVKECISLQKQQYARYIP